MNEKKVREAIEVIKANCPTSGYYMLRESLDIAIEALGKQLPMKPEEVVSAIYGKAYECKICGSEIEFIDTHADYCKGCGQRLDWSEVEA